LLVAPVATAGGLVDFDDLPLATNTSWYGPDPDGVEQPGRFGATEQVGAFVSQGVSFVNAYNLTFPNSWRGFAYSNLALGVATGFDTQFVASTGDGVGPGADNYGIAFGYHDLEEGFDERGPFNPGNPAHLNALPTLELPAGYGVASVEITNTVRVLDSLDNGDSFAKKFGGASGDDPDWLKVTAYGSDASGDLLTPTVDFYLADFRFDEPEDDFALRDWATWDLSPLADATRLHFNISSTDVGTFGLNTPAYFAIDDLVLSATAGGDPTDGDLNNDGLFTAADYAVWRDTGADAAAYDAWRAAFGGQPAAGAAVVTRAVPEPDTALPTLSAAILAPFFARRRAPAPPPPADEDEKSLKTNRQRWTNYLSCFR
ncbi:MAG: DUF4465 domain-containing protein, partial [Planctomycetota bacterium]